MKALGVALLAAFVLAGCGGSSQPSQPAGSIKVDMTEFKFDPSTITAPSGKVVFFLVNSGSQAHDMVIRDSTKKRIAGSELVSAGDAFVFTVDDIKAGSYGIYCNQPGHEASGMVGKLTIT